MKRPVGEVWWRKERREEALPSKPTLLHRPTRLGSCFGSGTAKLPCSNSSLRGTGSTRHCGSVATFLRPLSTRPSQRRSFVPPGTPPQGLRTPFDHSGPPFPQKSQKPSRNHLPRTFHSAAPPAASSRPLRDAAKLACEALGVPPSLPALVFFSLVGEASKPVLWLPL